MKLKSFVIAVWFATVLLFLLAWQGMPSAAADQPPASPTSPLDPSSLFIENVEQFDERAQFQLRGADNIVWLAEDGLWFTLLAPPEELFHNAVDNREVLPQQGVHIKLSFPGAKPISPPGTA